MCWVFIAACGLSLVAMSRNYSSLQCMGVSLWWLLLLQSTGSRCMGFCNCGAWAQLLRCINLVALRHVGSSWTRDQTCVPCIGRQILNHWTIREVPLSSNNSSPLFSTLELSMQGLSALQHSYNMGKKELESWKVKHLHSFIHSFIHKVPTLCQLLAEN